jgi:hypothetical protein
MAKARSRASTTPPAARLRRPIRTSISAAPSPTKARSRPQAAASTSAQTYDGSWTLLGATIATAVDTGGLYSQFATYDSHWNLLSQLDTQTNGQENYFIYGQAGGGQTIAAPSTHSDTFVFTPGELNGDVISGLNTLNLGGPIHDVIDFVGYGAGAALVQLSATQWEVTSANNPTETFTLTRVATLADGDYGFTASPPTAVAPVTATLSIDAVGGDGFIDAAETASGLVLSGQTFDASLAEVAGQTVTVTLNGKTYTATIDAEGGWSAAVGAADLAALTDGSTYQIGASFIDTQGARASTTRSVTVDDTASLAIGVIAGDGQIGPSQVAGGMTISGTSTGSTGAGDFSGQVVTVTLAGQSYKAAIAANGAWSVDIGSAALASLRNGQAYTVAASANDNADNAATATATVIVDDNALPLGSHVQQATAAGQTLTADGSQDTLYGSDAGGDTFTGTGASLNGDTLVDFGQTGDALDITDFSAGQNAKVGFTEDASNTFGTLTVTSGPETTNVILFGQYIASHFEPAGDGASGTLITYTPPAPMLVAGH